MKCNGAIPLGMSPAGRGRAGSAPADAAPPSPLVNKDYGDLLRQVFDSLSWPEKPGLQEFIKREAGVSYPTAWRVFEGKGTPRAAEKIRAALLRRGADPERLPPPFIPADLSSSSDGDAMVEWSDLGRRLAVADRDRFDDVMSELRELVPALERVARGMSAIKKPLP